MDKTTAELTNDYIREHPYIKICLRKNLINYSSLARLIAKELDIEKKTSKEAILIAARRFREKMKKEYEVEEGIKELLEQSEIELKNKITVYILEKGLDFDSIEDAGKKIRKDSGTFYFIEGSDHNIIITQEKYAGIIEIKFKHQIIKKTKTLALILMKSPQKIEQTLGFTAYVTSLFAENGVNIVELLSCWTDTLFLISPNDVNKALQFLKF